MKVQFESEDLKNATKELRTIADALSKRDVPADNLFREIAQRVANLEARMQTLESLLVTKTVAGKPKLTDEGQRVGRQWYQK